MQSKCKAMQSNFTRLVFVLILSNYLIINEAVALFRYAVFMQLPHANSAMAGFRFGIVKIILLKSDNCVLVLQ